MSGALNDWTEWDWFAYCLAKGHATADLALRRSVDDAALNALLRRAEYRTAFVMCDEGIEHSCNERTLNLMVDAFAARLMRLALRP